MRASEGVQCVGMSDLGTVIVVFVPAASSSYELWRGDGESFTQVATNLASLCASIDDSDGIAYLTPLTSGSTCCEAREEQHGNADNTGTFGHDTVPVWPHDTSPPSLSNNGSAVFMTAEGNGIAVRPAGPIVYDPSIGPPLTLISPVSMNDSLTVAFLALVAGRAGIYRGSAVPLIETVAWSQAVRLGFSRSARHQQFGDSRVCRKCRWGRSARLHHGGRCVSEPSSARIQLTDSPSTTRARSRIGRTRREKAQRATVSTSANPDRSTKESLVLATRLTARPSRPGLCGRNLSIIMDSLLSGRSLPTVVGGCTALIRYRY